MENIDKLFDYYNQFISKLQTHYDKLTEEERKRMEDEIDSLCVQLSKNIYYIESHSRSLDVSSIQYYEHQIKYVDKSEDDETKETTRDVHKEDIS